MSEKRVLVIDDDPDVLESLGILVTEIGYAVETAVSGAEALGKLEQAEFDLILTDFQMPGMDGAQVATAVKKLRPRMPVVLVSGRSFDSNYSNVSASLKKPFTLSELRNVLAACLP